MTRSRRAWSTSITEIAARGSVQPLHIASGILPNAHGENHTSPESHPHTSHTPSRLECILAPENRHFVDAVLIVNRVVRLKTRNHDFAVLDNLSILNIYPTDLRE